VVSLVGDKRAWVVSEVNARRVFRLFNRTSGRDEHPTAASAALNMTRQIDRPLPPPAGDQGVERLDVDREQCTWRTPRLEREKSPDTGANGPRQCQERRRLDGTLLHLVSGLGCEIVERIGVLTQQIS
jgi:hypothetical protein